MRLQFHSLLAPEFQSGFRKLGELPSLTTKQRYALAKSLRKIKQELETFNHVRDGILKAHGTDKGNGQWEIPDQNAKSFNAAMKDLFQTEVELPLLAPIKIDGECSLTAAELEVVLDLVELCDETTGNETKRNELAVVDLPAG